jgi:type VI secretion system lysozyme-like protein
MAERRVQHVPMPLFDRLVDLEPQRSREVRPLRTLDRQGLRESVRRELERLLSTRTSLPAHRLLERSPEDFPLSVVDFGLPDLVAYSARNQDHWPLIAEAIRRVIAAFEPRLARPEVEVTAAAETNWTLRVQIRGVLVIDDVEEPVSFPTVLQPNDAEVTVHGNAR